MDRLTPQPKGRNVIALTEKPMRLLDTTVEKIDSPQLVHYQTDSSYRRADAVSQSELKEILKSPAHHQLRYGPNAQPSWPSANMITGTAIHHRTLEPGTFQRNFVCKSDVPPEPIIAELKKIANDSNIDIKGLTKKSDIMSAIYPDGLPKETRTTISDADWLVVNGCADALRVHDHTGPWFDPSLPSYRKFNEVSLYDRDQMGIARKCRIDRLHIDVDEGVIKIIDIKSIDDARPHSFARKCAELGYHLQAWWYSDMVRRVMNHGALQNMSIEFYFAVVERKSPHAINVFKASDELLSAGAALADRGLHALAQCRELEWWPGYEPIIHSLKLPSWYGISDDPLDDVAF